MTLSLLPLQILIWHFPIFSISRKYASGRPGLSALCLQHPAQPLPCSAPSVAFVTSQRANKVENSRLVRRCDDENVALLEANLFLVAAALLRGSVARSNRGRVKQEVMRSAESLSEPPHLFPGRTFLLETKWACL